MKRMLTSFVFALLLGFPLAQASKLNKKVEPLIKAFEQNTRSMGTIFIQSDGETFYKSIGFSSDNPLTSNSLNSIFLIASLSKQMTAAGILRLVDLGVITLETKVSDLLPELNKKLWTKNGVSATVHHLLNHTAGTPDAYSNRDIKQKLFREPISMQNILDSIKNLNISYTPGSQFTYSNTGYILLGEIVRRRSGLSYSEYMNREFFHSFPNTSVGRPSLNKIALSYMDDKTGHRVDYIDFKNIKERHDGDVFTDGNIYANVSDLIKWTNKLASRKILSPAMTEKMFSPGLQNYGYGWIISKLADGSDLYWHNGSWLGYTGDIYHIPTKDITLVWLRNQEGSSVENSSLNSAIIKKLVN
jgi:CubicO group peptidase (beta-lactamase class C family)